MATTTIYNNALLEMARGSLTIPANATHKVMLLAPGSTYSAVKSHAYVSDVLGSGGTEVASGAGYTPGGNAVPTVAAAAISGTNNIGITFSDVSWPSSTISARQAIIYKPGATAGVYTDAKLIAHIDFGTTITSSASTFTVSFSSPLKLVN